MEQSMILLLAIQKEAELKENANQKQYTHGRPCPIRR